MTTAEIPKPALWGVGSFRVVYSIDDRALVVEVVKVGDRKDVYRRPG